MSAADLYDRIRENCCGCHGFADADEFERHVRAIVTAILQVRGQA